ncbi:MAG: aerobic carbon-monoxide dehydrogenase medium subunit, partial [Thermoleophilales bacterium]|nr:aerobic carbon-monoxide dehydrogenase medium subunit [Thermoleophilales bacterium]
QGGDDAKLLAGGHSLLPLMKLRFAAPGLLVDLKNVPGLKGIETGNGAGTKIGALTTHAMIQADDSLGLPSAAAKLIADQQVRNRGTIGGSLAHGDPASDLPTVLLAMDGRVTARGPNGEREIAAADLFQDYLTTAVAADEVLTDVRLPSMEGYRHAYLKFSRRSEDWAMVGVAALVRGTDTFEDVRIGLTHMGSTPLRATQVEQALIGQPIEAGRIRAAAEAAAEGTDPPGDLNATPDYKRELARVLVRRALEQAAAI